MGKHAVNEHMILLAIREEHSRVEALFGHINRLSLEFDGVFVIVVPTRTPATRHPQFSEQAVQRGASALFYM